GDGPPPMPVSMNVSRVNLYNPALVATLCQLADRYGVPRCSMELEITESAYAEDPKQLSGLITQLRAQGFIVEMDDFGSAYSSLNMLKEIPVDVLKLDMRFLYGNDRDGRGGTILSSVVRMARYLSLPIVAEGVQTAEQAHFLYSIGCNVGQGYYYYEPMPVPDFERLLLSAPLRSLSDAVETLPAASIRRVWSIDGDFSLILASIPCAASLCELNGDNLEILRINDEYLSMTGDSIKRIYTMGTHVNNLTTEENYQNILRTTKKALETKGAVEVDYYRTNEDGTQKKYHLKIRYLTGDQMRSLFFITYLPTVEKGGMI
ncbi:MAG: EAL domain-containing protein, partial [Clostridia bacterium]|nr:EAL domain-containing protein [Clostridia bacterium]